MIYYKGALYYIELNMKGGVIVKKKLRKPIAIQDDTILNLYNSENGQDACCSGSNGQCLC